jgi:RNA polymerase sigma-70 factor, ECF subfamily
MGASGYKSRYGSKMDRSQFHRMFLEHQGRLFGFVLTLLPNVNDAEEVFQDTCVVILDKCDQFRPGTDFMRWSCQIAKYEVLAFRRRSRRRLFVLCDADFEDLSQRCVEMGSQLAARQRALRQCMEKLRDPDRRLIEARYAEKTNSRAVAASLQMQENTVYKALQRIRRALRQCIDARVAQEDHA